MIADLCHWLAIPHTGIDTENFHSFATYNCTSRDMPYMLTSYTIFLTYLYMLTDCSRPIAQFINVMMGMGVLLILIKTCRILNLRNNHIKLSLLLLAFAPNMIFFSGILLREAWIEFFVAMSIMAFAIWYKRGKAKQFILSIIYVIVATVMHAGVMPMIIVYLFALLIYSPKFEKIRFSTSKLVLIGMPIALCVIIFGQYITMVSEKFSNVTSDNVAELMNVSNVGGSAYLLWLPATNNLFVHLLYLPLRIFYFFFSPLPTDWRGIEDIIAFMGDSAIYVFLFYSICKRYALQRYVTLKYFVVAAVLFSSAMYSFGTNASGTAIRHRAKLMEPLCIAYCLSIYKLKNKEEPISL